MGSKTATKLYIYLGRRDKTGVKVLMTIPGPIYPATRISDIKDLKLPGKLEKELGYTIHEHRMLWEPWIEGVGDYDELKQSLLGRGYKNVPEFHTPKYAELAQNIASKRGPIQPALKDPVKTMTRRESQLKSRSANVGSVNKKTSRINIDKKILPIDISNDTPIFKKFKR